ncbi:TPA: hypothetical protein JGU28_004550 [Salmonella enterica]|nr:hypothetical protein [Salmonella enterica]
MFIPFFSETASPSKKNNEVSSVFLLLQKQLRQKNPMVTLSCSKWCYVLLPGRISEDNWASVISKGYYCLYSHKKKPFAIILHSGDEFYPVITDILSNQNDFVYFITFATHLPRDHRKLLEWIDILINNKSMDMLPPYALLTFESGYLIL